MEVEELVKQCFIENSKDILEAMRYFTMRALLIAVLLVGHQLQAQWTAPYANSWINYDQPYVKIGILKKGLHRVPFSSLPKGFPVGSPEKFQLWRRGKEVSIISTANQEIVFYAVPNDGASDSLLYRPMSSRVNPYYSFYSDEGAYFLTVGDKPGNRAKTISQPVDNELPLFTSHLEKATTTLQDEYSLTTQVFIRPKFFNSYFEWGASRTGKTLSPDSLFTRNFKLKHLKKGAKNVRLHLLLHGRSGSDRKVGIYVGKTAQSLRLVTTLNIAGFNFAKYTAEIQTGDLDANQNGILGLKSVSTDIYNGFSLTYYTLEYAQEFQMEGLSKKEFYLEQVKGAWSRIAVTGAPVQARFLDISDRDNPVIIESKPDNLMVPRQAGKSQVLLATSEVTQVNASNIMEVKFKEFPSEEPNYIVITTKRLMNGATQLAEYRASKAGGQYKPLVVDVRDLYNQFNYGEPSPVAIKKFIAYMLAEGGTDKMLFLIGHSITHNEKMKRELPDEVPTIGYPASDLLLVEGIAGTEMNAPAIPVGRLSAFTDQQVLDYLQKIKDYEQNGAGEYKWRKNVLHLSGGGNLAEITQFREMLKALAPAARNGIAGGRVKHYVKKQAMKEVESVNIAADVNAGSGLITFFGHGSSIETDPDMGYATEAARGYHNLHRYPMMYFNGCGVGNIFSGRSNPTPKSPRASDRLPLSLDWLLAADRGAIAIIANSFESFVSPASGYLAKLYQCLFSNPATVDLPIGKIQWFVATDIILKQKDMYGIANAHQSILQGDPALKVVTTEKPDYVLDPDKSITLLSQSPEQTMEVSDSLRVQVAVGNYGRFRTGDEVSVKITWAGKQGKIIKQESIKALPYEDTLTVAFRNSNDIQNIRVELDAPQAIAELDENNNVAELDVDWEAVKHQTSFSGQQIDDIVAPLISVKLNDRMLKKDEVVEPEPVLTITVSDDRLLSADTALVDVFIKRCGDEQCDFEKLIYGEGQPTMEPDGPKSFHLRYKANWGPGSYEILVTAKDRSGNSSPSSYRMFFKIADHKDASPELIVSPNPANSYLRFELKSATDAGLSSVRYLIYDQRGILVEDKTFAINSLSSITEWYWQPVYQAVGLYVYKVMLVDQNNKPSHIFSGKVVLTK